MPWARVRAFDTLVAPRGAAVRGDVPADARAWQRRWDGVIVPRAALLALALGALAEDGGCGSRERCPARLRYEPE